MPRFVKQRDHYSCGPAAVANAIKALGGSISYSKTYKILRVACRTTPGSGTDDGGFSRALEKFLPIYVSGRINVLKRWFPTLSQIEKHLRLGGVVVVNWRYSDGCGHYTVISNLDRELFTLLNYTKGKTTTRIRRATFSKAFQGKSKDYMNRGWFIRREDG
jgi:hypothetical protein